jgi:Asp-tRNA(Asn)/Glu-tRNA(Gln) amidotransferase B subunit
VKKMDYEIVIGLEVHSELATKSKIYCTCTTEFGGEPNTHCCPICTGMPGVLPVLNKNVVEYAVKAGLATNCEIAHYSKQDRKNYFFQIYQRHTRPLNTICHYVTKGILILKLTEFKKESGLPEFI